MVIVVMVTLWLLAATAFVAHTARRRLVARVAAGLLALEVIDLTLSDLGSAAGTARGHAFAICAVAVVPVASAALLGALVRPRRARAPARARRRASPR